jgi:hypothetical protein
MLCFYPEAGSVVSPALTLSGYGYDAEDGDLGDDAMAWTSDRDGPLGKGRLLRVAGLSAGTHRLVLAVTDSHGQTASSSVTIHVGAQSSVTRKVYLPLVVRQFP